MAPAQPAPHVSVVLPTFNRAALLAEAIQSVLDQDFEGWELLVVDDGSTDGTAEVVAGFAGDPRICYLYQENRGQAAARNHGISRAQGAWVAFLDSDDRWLPFKLRAQCGLLADHPEIDVLYGEMERIGIDGRVLPGRAVMHRYSGQVWRELLNDNFIPFSTAIVRRTALAAVGGFDDTVRRADDYDLWLRLSAQCRFHFLPGVIAQYRFAGGRISDDIGGRYGSNLRAVCRFLDMNPGRLSPMERRDVLSRQHGRFARGFAARGHYSRGVAEAVRSVGYSPLSWRSWRTFLAVTLSPVRRALRGENR